MLWQAENDQIGILDIPFGNRYIFKIAQMTDAAFPTNEYRQPLSTASSDQAYFRQVASQLVFGERTRPSTRLLYQQRAAEIINYTILAQSQLQQVVDTEIHYRQ